MIYPNLRAEMAKQGISQAELADRLGKGVPTMSLKLNGKSPITLDEALSIKKALKTRLSIEALFTRD